MESGFNIFRKLDDGEILYVAWRADRKNAEQLVRQLSEWWPADYGIAEGAGEPSSWLDQVPTSTRWIH
jgi:hypothetical protein